MTALLPASKKRIRLSDGMVKMEVHLPNYLEPGDILSLLLDAILNILALFLLAHRARSTFFTVIALYKSHSYFLTYLLTKRPAQAVT